MLLQLLLSCHKLIQPLSRLLSSQLFYYFPSRYSPLSTMNPTNNSVDGLLQWLAQSQQPLPPPQQPSYSLPTDLPGPGSVTMEALLAGNFSAPQPQQKQNNYDTSSALLQFLQQGPGRANNTLDSSFAPLAQMPEERRGTPLLDTMNAMRGQYSQQQQQQAPVYQASGFPTKKKGLNQRQEFFVLVKILLKVLKDNQDMDRLVRAKAIIAECTHRNRNGDSAFSNLQGSVESRLRRTVGEVYWSQAKDRITRARRVRGIRHGVVAAV